MASSGEDPDRERELTMDLLQRGVQGLLIVPAGSDHRYPVSYTHLTLPTNREV